MPFNGNERRRTNHWPLIAFLVLAFAAAWANIEAHSVAKRADDTANQIIRESKERRHQICLADETAHEDTISGLIRTYAYVEALEPNEYGQTINKFIIQRLPETEKDAKSDAVPAFCNEPDVGRPEPDPEVPDRPEKVQYVMDLIAKS